MTNVAFFIGNVGAIGVIKFATQYISESYTQIATMLEYTKRVNSATLKLNFVSGLTNSSDGTVNINVSGQAVNSTQTYAVTGPNITRTNFPSQYTVTSKVTEVLLTSSFTTVNGASNYVYFCDISNADPNAAHSAVVNVSGRDFTFSLPVNGDLAFLIVNTTSGAAFGDPNNSNWVFLDVWAVPLSNVNTESYTIQFQELDSNNNVLSSGSLSTTLYWINLLYIKPDAVTVTAFGGQVS